MRHVSCAEQGFTSNELSMAVGIEGRSVRRNSPTIYNVAYAARLFHDGREFTLEQQVWGPLLAKNEMGNPSVGYVLNKIRQIQGYSDQFKSAFAGEGVNMLNLGKAIAAYQRTLISADSAFDRWYFAKQENALDDNAKRGFRIFVGKGKCAHCHTINSKFALLTDNQMHNTGIGYLESQGNDSEQERVVLAPGIFIDIDRKAIETVAEKTRPDLGL